jgi:hypothetical protein
MSRVRMHIFARFSSGEVVVGSAEFTWDLLEPNQSIPKGITPSSIIEVEFTDVGTGRGIRVFPAYTIARLQEEVAELKAQLAARELTNA